MQQERPINCKWHNLGCQKMPEDIKRERGELEVGTVVGDGDYYRTGGVLLTPTAADRPAGVVEIFVPIAEVPALIELLQNRIDNLESGE